MKITLKSALCILAAVTLVSCGGNNKKKEAAEAQQPEALQVSESVMDKVAALPEEPVFEIVTTMGSIKVKLYSQTPKHRENFAKLALSEFYDGILFHRVINGFMIQTGDPLTKDAANAPRYGTGGPGYNVPAEFVPEYTHKKGALAAARRGDAVNPLKESSGSQFYIVQDEMSCASLDGDYTVFGETIEGLDVIDKIAAVETNERDCPLNEVKILKIKLVQ